MKSEQEIKEKIKTIEADRLKLICEQKSYKFTSQEWLIGSKEYGQLQEKETDCKKKINLLTWIID